MTISTSIFQFNEINLRTISSGSAPLFLFSPSRTLQYDYLDQANFHEVPIAHPFGSSVFALHTRYACIIGEARSEQCRRNWRRGVFHENRLTRSAWLDDLLRVAGKQATWNAPGWGRQIWAKSVLFINLPIFHLKCLGALSSRTFSICRCHAKRKQWQVQRFYSNHLNDGLFARISISKRREKTAKQSWRASVAHILSLSIWCFTDFIWTKSRV